MTGRAASNHTPLGVVWEGSFFAHQSVANVNREVAALLAERRDIDLGLIPFERDDFDESTDLRYRTIESRIGHRPDAVQCHVRHICPPNFARPERGALILVQPWEYSSLPLEWVDAIAATVDEVWAYSDFIRDTHLRSGVHPDKVKTVPLGINPEAFHPAVPPAELEIDRSFRFLFVGGGIERKGFDLLLRAYVAEFGADDDVCLVIKDFFYGGGGAGLVRALQAQAGTPEIRYTYGSTDPNGLGALYTSCDCYVHPYRGEGFGLPIVEAMACGLPVIVTGAGPALELCSQDTAYFVPAVETPVPSEVWPWWLPTAEQATWLEPDLAELRRLMRHVFEHRDEARRKGAQGSVRVSEHYTWARTVDEMVRRLDRWRPDRASGLTVGT